MSGGERRRESAVREPPPRQHRPEEERSYAVAWVLVAAAAFGVGLWLLVPWDWLPGGDLAPIDPTGGLAAGELDNIERYRSSVHWWRLGQGLATSVVLLLLGLTRFGSRMVRRLPGADRIWPLRVMIAVLATVGAGWWAQLPFAVGVEQARSAEGFVGTGWVTWLQGQLGALFGLWALASLGVLLIGLAARLMPRWWWRVLSVVAAVLVVIGAWTAAQLGTSGSGLPSMSDGPLRSSLLRLADEMDVEVRDIKVVPETPTVQVFNAYVAPVGDGYDVVVFETMLNRASADEVTFVAAHELAHIEQADAVTSAVLLGFGIAAGVALVGGTVTSRRVRRRAGIGRAGEVVADVAAVPLLLALGVVATIMVVPALDAMNRATEARADVAALEATGDPDGLVRLQRRLSVLYLEDPYPSFLARLASSHPSHAERIALAEGWEAARTE